MADAEKDTATATADSTPKKHKLPDGWITPVAARHRLVEEGLAKSTMNSAQIYILSRNAEKNGMPVKHFDAAGNQYDAIQIVDGETTTRPGFQWDSLREWWTNRPKREAKAKTADDKKPTEDAASSSDSDLEDEAAAGEGDEDFVEAE